MGLHRYRSLNSSEHKKEEQIIMINRGKILWRISIFWLISSCVSGTIIVPALIFSSSLALSSLFDVILALRIASSTIVLISSWVYFFSLIVRYLPFLSWTVVLTGHISLYVVLFRVAVEMENYQSKISRGSFAVCRSRSRALIIPFFRFKKQSFCSSRKRGIVGLQ